MFTPPCWPFKVFRHLPLITFLVICSWNHFHIEPDHSRAMWNLFKHSDTSATLNTPHPREFLQWHLTPVDSEYVYIVSTSTSHFFIAEKDYWSTISFVRQCSNSCILCIMDRMSQIRMWLNPPLIKISLGSSINGLTKPVDPDSVCSQVASFMFQIFIVLSSLSSLALHNLPFFNLMIL